MICIQNWELLVFYPWCQRHFGDTKLRCRKEQKKKNKKKWEREQGKSVSDADNCKTSTKSAVPSTAKSLLRIMFFSPVPSTWWLIFLSKFEKASSFKLIIAELPVRRLLKVVSTEPSIVCWSIVMQMSVDISGWCGFLLLLFSFLLSPDQRKNVCSLPLTKAITFYPTKPVLRGGGGGGGGGAGREYRAYILEEPFILHQTVTSKY